jgi:hypothetical protein
VKEQQASNAEILDSIARKRERSADIERLAEARV